MQRLLEVKILWVQKTVPLDRCLSVCISGLMVLPFLPLFFSVSPCLRGDPAEIFLIKFRRGSSEYRLHCRFKFLLINFARDLGLCFLFGHRVFAEYLVDHVTSGFGLNLCDPAFWQGENLCRLAADQLSAPPLSQVCRRRHTQPQCCIRIFLNLGRIVAFDSPLARCFGSFQGPFIECIFLSCRLVLSGQQDACQAYSLKFAVVLLVISVGLFRRWITVFFLETSPIQIGHSAQARPVHQLPELGSIFYACLLCHSLNRHKIGKILCQVLPCERRDNLTLRIQGRHQRLKLLSSDHLPA